MMTKTDRFTEMRGFGLRLYQADQGYRFSLDPFLLAGFCTATAGERAVDLGTGVGILPLLLTARLPLRTCTGVEIQPELAALARRNVELNGQSERVRIVEADLRCYRETLAPQSADLVVANPPYRAALSGRQAATSQQAAARHELAGGLDDFIAAAAFVLKHGGRFYLIQLAERLADLLVTLRNRNLEAKRLRLIHSRSGEPARLVMVEGRRAGRPGLKVEPPLYIYHGDRYSDEVLACYGEAVS